MTFCKCPYCPEFYATKQPLYSHINAKHPGKTIAKEKTTRKPHKTIVFNEKIATRMDLTCEKVTYLLEKSLEEQQALKKFASKITKVPDTLRVYGPGE